MSERLERLQREIAAEKSAVLAQLGVNFDGVVLVLGDAQIERVIQKRLARVPQVLRVEAETRLRRSVIRLPWLLGRRISATEVSA